jgi:hypothetical protein
VISIEDQIAAMAAEWPGLTVVEQAGRRAVWEGDLTPFETTYRVRISYEVPLAPAMLYVGTVAPRIRVLAPELERHDDYHLGPLPHVFWRGENRDEPELCVFDPAANEWSPCDLLAETTVPWALRWLVRYEGWLATKRWEGKGRAHDRYRGKRFRDDGSPVRKLDRWLTSTSALACRPAV